MLKIPLGGLKKFKEWKGMTMAEKTINVKIIKDICFSKENGRKLLADLYLPADKEEFPLLVFFYGNGLEGGDKRDMSVVALEFVQRGVAVALPNYRSYPEVSYPSFFVDAAKSIAFFQKEIKKYGDCQGIFIGGHSAGAYLALMIFFERYYLEQQKVDPNSIRGCISASGQPTTHYNILKHRGIQSDWIVIDEAAPMYHITEEVIEEGAPLLIFVTDNDIKNRLEHTEFFVSTLKEYGYKSEVQYHLLKGHDHMSYLRNVLIDDSIPFIKKHLK